MRSRRPGRRVLSFPLFPALLLAGAIAGCESAEVLDEEAEGSEPSCTGRGEGDLVITEFLADPQGTDAGKEYFEVFNATGEELDLRGLAVAFSDAEGARVRTHAMGTARIAPGGYFVVGDARAETLPPHLDYSYGDTLGALGNGSGRIELRCGDTLVDAVRWDLPGRAGKARVLGGDGPPDAWENDRAEAWCDATAELSAGTFGSPGEPNAACANPEPGEALCRDPADGRSRTVVPPRPGELVLTEILANPSGSDADSKEEWMELYAREAFDLNGLTVSNGSSTAILAADTCLHVARGDYAVLAQSLDPTRNGGITGALGLFGFSLANGAATVEIAAGGTLLDAVSYSAAAEGAATQFGGLPEVAANDAPGAFCPATATYGTGSNRGSPGAPNSPCPPVVPDGHCSEGGTVRPLRSPRVGDLVLTEIMANASGTESETEWFEVYVRGSDLDLNGVELSFNGGAPRRLDSAECIRRPAGTYLLFARSLSPSQNGGLPQPFESFDFGLSNTGGTLRISFGEELLDEVTYGDQTEDGVAHQLAGGPDAVANDEATAFCPASATYGGGASRGSPGIPNSPCPQATPDSYCLENGTARPVRPPSCGDLVLSEIMANAPGTEAESEWFEIYVRGSGFDLNGLELSTQDGTTAELRWEECLSPATGSYLLFARSTNLWRNGGLPAPYATFDFDLANGGGTLRLGFGGGCLTEVSYPTQTQDAIAFQLSQPFVVAGLDEPQFFCPASGPYGLGWGWGTPGSPNAACWW